MSKTYKALQDRLQFVLVLVLFFPVSLDALYKAAGSPQNSPNLTLQWGLIIVIYIICYLLLEYIKDDLSHLISLFTDRLFLLELASFVPILWLIALSDRIVSKLFFIPFVMGGIGLLSIPVITLVLLTINFLHVCYKRN